MLKKQLKIIILIVCAVFFTQCANEEILIYNRSYDGSGYAREFYDFGFAKNIKLDKVLFIGDSHVANDTMSRLFRYKLNSYSKFSNFITPKYQYNSTLNMEQDGFSRMLLKDKELGINLATYSSKDKAHIIFHGNVKNPSIFVNFIENNAKITVKQNSQIIKTIQAVKVGKWQKITIDGLDGDFELFVDGMVYFAGIENMYDRYVDNLGINGASLSWWYYTNHELFNMQVDDFQYDLAVVSFGTNESINPHSNIKEYKTNLIKLVSILKQSGAKVVLLSPHYSVYYDGNDYQKAPLYDEVKKVLMDVAKSEKIMLYDMNAFMQNMGGKERMIELGYSQKDTHLSLSGYYEVGMRLYENIKK